METEGVYLARVVRNGLCTYRWYDVTEYECYHRGGIGGVSVAAEVKYDSGGRKLPKPERQSLKALAIGGLGVAGVKTTAASMGRGRFLNGETIGSYRSRDRQGVLNNGSARRRSSVRIGGGDSGSRASRMNTPEAGFDDDVIEDRRHLSPLLSLMMLDNMHLNHPNLKQVHDAYLGLNDAQVTFRYRLIELDY